MQFPYSESQITAAVRALKRPRDGVPLTFATSGMASRRCDASLERADGKNDRLRLIIRAGRLDDPFSYMAALLLEDTRIRGIDYHPIERRRFYKEISPKGWHEDVIDPNRDPLDKGHHLRIALPDFAPSDLQDFLRMACRQWNIELPPASEMLL